jgi:hypothetical protein
MKIVKQVTIHPELGNDVRQEVIDWCIKQFGDPIVQEVEYDWWINSNYERSNEGTFDITFTSLKSAEFFILRWGGVIVDTKYNEVFVPDPEILKSLFY